MVVATAFAIVAACSFAVADPLVDPFVVEEELDQAFTVILGPFPFAAFGFGVEDSLYCSGNFLCGYSYTEDYSFGCHLSGCIHLYLCSHLDLY